MVSLKVTGVMLDYKQRSKKDELSYGKNFNKGDRIWKKQRK